MHMEYMEILSKHSSFKILEIKCILTLNIHRMTDNVTSTQHFVGTFTRQAQVNACSAFTFDFDAILNNCESV